MADPARRRYRIRFAKTEAMRFTSHLDLHRSWERTFRRAGLPLAYSEGFNPQPKLNIGAALPLGCLSQGDLIDAWLEAEIDPGEVESSLRQASPPGIQVEDVQFVEAGEPVLQRRVQAAIYEAVSPTPGDPTEIEGRIGAVMRADHLPRTRRGKSYDLRPLVEELRFDRLAGKLSMRLTAREGATGRPEEVLDALGLGPTDFLIRRVELVLAEQAAISPPPPPSNQASLDASS